MKAADSTSLISKEQKEKNKELVTKYDVKDSPFTVIGTEEGFFACIGKYRITEPTKLRKDAIKDVESMTWNRITQLILILIEAQK